MNNVAIVTSFPGRISTINTTVMSLVNQLEPFNEIVIVLYRDEFQNGVPANMEELLKFKNVKLKWLTYADTYGKNMMAFKKLFAALDYANTDTLVYTCDDDFLYTPWYTTIYSKLHEKCGDGVFSPFFMTMPWKKLHISGARNVYSASILNEKLIRKYLENTKLMDELAWKQDDELFQIYINELQVPIYEFGLYPYLTRDMGMKGSVVTDRSEYSKFKDSNRLYLDDDEWRKEFVPDFKEGNFKFLNVPFLR